MTKEEAVRKLKNLPKGDNEIAHSTADDILLEFLEAEGFKVVAEAFRQADKDITFWYA